MRNIKYLLYGIALLILAGGCRKKEEGPEVVPDDLKVNVSSAISFPDLDKKKALILSDSLLTGKKMYQYLRTLVYVGDFSAGMIQHVLDFVRTRNITGPVSFSYTSPDDGREKLLVVEDHFLFSKEYWDYGLTIADSKLGNAFLMVWNLSPLKAVAILHPVAYNYEATEQRNAFIKVEYSEGNQKYDRTMIVSVAGMDSIDARSVRRMKLFFGQKGDIVSLFGNFNMPYGYVVSPDEKRGRSWSFKAKNNVKLDIAVARCGIPFMTVSTVDKIWSYYSMDQVLERQIMFAYPETDTTVVETIVSDAVGIAYLEGQQGFVSNDKENPDPAKFTQDFIDMSGIDPWPPATVEAMSISF